jgi:hypothetical protein
MQLQNERPVALQRDLKLEEPPNRRWRFFVNWLLESLTPAVPVVSTTGASSLKSPASIWLWAIVLVFALSNVAHAVPTTTSYQGYLENSEAEPLNATINMTFALYDVAENGDALWTETHQQVVVTNGVFSLVLGNGTSFDDVDLNGKRYLGIAVGGDSEMVPRQELSSSFFAMQADSVKAASVDSDAIAEGAVTGGKIAPQTITGDKIAAGVTITAEERQKLVDLGTGGVGSDPTFDTVVVKEQLNVKNRIKVGENSLYMGDSPTDLGTEQIYTKMYTNIGNVVVTPALRIQSMEYPNNSGYENPNTIINGLEGNVGIGTGIDDDSPEEKLHVNGAVLLGPLNTVPDSKDNRLYNIKDVTNVADGLYWNGELLSGSSGADDDWTVSGTGSNSKVYRTDGDVGIGTADPKGKLDVDGMFKISPKAFSVSEYFNNGTGVFINYDTSNPLGEGGAIKSLDSDKSKFKKLAIDGNPTLINAAGFSGNVGIGTKTPEAKLHVNGGLRAKKGDTNQADKSDVGYAFDGDGDTGMFAVGGEFVQNSDLHFKVDNQTTLVVRDNGNVGIGTTTPSCKLDVNGNTCLGSNDYLKIGPWKMYQTGGGDVTSYLYIGRTTDMLVRIDWNGRMRAKEFKKWSDERWKTDITPLEGSLEKVSKLQGITYKWDIENNPDIRFDDETHIGFTAQNVEQVLPELVSTDEDGYKSMSYGDMTAVLVEAVKELKAQNDALKAIVCEDHPEKAICQ